MPAAGHDGGEDRCATLPPGDLLRVLATDPLAPQDFRDFCAAGGHDLVEAREVRGAFEGLIRVGRSAI